MPNIEDNMILLPGGEFTMGSDRHYPEEAPSRRVYVDPFRIDATPVTNADFTKFVAATDYVTFAELAPDPADYPGMDPALAIPASLVFVPTSGPVDLSDPLAWWQLVAGACWRNPRGPGSNIGGLDDHPVVQIAAVDATAYAEWAGKTLPTEAEWEYAARGGMVSTDYAWGDELEPEGIQQANYWPGDFPWRRTVHNQTFTSPVGYYPPNGFGLSDMIGNVWEWTADYWSTSSVNSNASPCCIPKNPRGGTKGDSLDPSTPVLVTPRRVLKGGSHLCAPSYCQRYRPAARYPQPEDTTTSHVGFRCVKQ